MVECKKNYCQDYSQLNVVIDEVNCENFFHRVQVKSLEEELVDECNAKLKKVSMPRLMPN